MSFLNPRFSRMDNSRVTLILLVIKSFVVNGRYLLVSMDEGLDVSDKMEENEIDISMTTGTN